MILEIDIGNTRIKWRVRGEQKIYCSHSAYSSLLSSEKNYHAIFQTVDSEIAQIYIASVATAYHTVLVDWLARRFQCQPIFSEVSVKKGGVVNGYTDVSQMGVDRWLALLASWSQMKRACLVVDAGSAVTVDLLLSGGVHHGGYIVPGLQMMNTALFRDTDKVKIAHNTYPLVLDAGKGTQSAVLSGLPSMLLGLIERALRQMQAEGVNHPSIVVTGGDGEYVARLLEVEGYDHVKYIPDLVLDGLSVDMSVAP
jgi:type III pantothenate kinase